MRRRAVGRTLYWIKHSSSVDSNAGSGSIRSVRVASTHASSRNGDADRASNCRLVKPLATLLELLLLVLLLLLEVNDAASTKRRACICSRSNRCARSAGWSAKSARTPSYKIARTDACCESARLRKPASSK
jgi:hypothetical protein